LSITYSPVDGNAAPLTYADGGTGVSSMIRTTQNFYGNMSQEELVTLMQTKIDAAILASSTPTLDVTVSYDEVTKGFKFTAAGGEEIKVGGGSIFKISAAGGTQVMITQPKAGVFRAFNPACTHLGIRLNRISGTNILCEMGHGARFDSNTGNVTRGPAQKPLQKYTLTLEKNTIYVTLNS
jgi:nitrite reductase/ring-hydroxylating ferredoxin subunit